MNDILLLCICIFTTGLAGWITQLVLTGGRHYGFHAAGTAGLSILFGFGIVTIQMFLMTILGAQFTRMGILAPWIPAALVAVAFLRKSDFRNYGSPTSGDFRSWARRLSPCSAVLVILIAVQVGYNFFRAMMRPIEAYDSVAIYGLKAKIIYAAGGIGTTFFKDMASGFHGAHADYPLFIPLSETWVFTFLSGFNDVLVKAIFPLFYLSFLLVFFAVVVRITRKRALSLIATFALASIKQFSDYSTIGVADLTLGIFFSICIMFLYLWFRERKPGFLSISLFSLVLCVWTKNEGMVLSCLTLAVLGLFALFNRRRMPTSEGVHLSLYALIIVSVIFSWLYFKHLNSLGNENFNISMLGTGNLLSRIGRLPIILYEYQKQFFGFKKWNITWLIFLFLLVTKFRTAFSGDLKFVTIIFIIFISAYTFVYLFSIVETDFFVRTTLSRFLLHILPVCSFWGAIMIHKIGGAKE